jgi:hypothetical protein
LLVVPDYDLLLHYGALPDPSRASKEAFGKIFISHRWVKLFSKLIKFIALPFLMPTKLFLNCGKKYSGYQK